MKNLLIPNAAKVLFLFLLSTLTGAQNKLPIIGMRVHAHEVGPPPPAEEALDNFIAPKSTEELRRISWYVLHKKIILIDYPPNIKNEIQTIIY